MDKIYEYWLCSMPDLGNKSITRLLKSFGSPRAVYEAKEDDLRLLLTERQTEIVKVSRNEFDLHKEYENIKDKNIHFLTIEEKDYPGRLKLIPDAPYGVFVKGMLPEEEQISVAVIGARDCSEYGRYIAQELGRELAENKIQVISGLARGIDGISQDAALRAGGTSFGVLGCGVDICYPSQNRQIYEALLEQGGLLSIYPPGTKPQPYYFPPRNRIVSGLADAVVVIEARQKSGTLITVDMALEQGREVYAVPGRITDRLSDGCNKLINQGAGVLLSPKDFIAEIKMLLSEKQLFSHTLNELTKNVPHTSPMTAAAADIQDEADLLLTYLDFYPQSIEEIKSKLPQEYTYTQILSLLIQLSINGKAVQVSGGHFLKRQP